MLGITTGMDQKECYVSPCRKLRISAVAVPRRSSISCCGAEAYSHGLAVQQTIEFPPVAPVHVVDVPVMQVVQLPRWFAVLGHGDDMPVVGNNRCLELDSVEKIAEVPQFAVLRWSARCWTTSGPHGPDSADARGGPTGAVLGQGCAHARYCASFTVQKPVEFPQVLFWDKDVDMLAVVPDRFLVSTCR